jgi:hypothetical protein
VLHAVLIMIDRQTDRQTDRHRQTDRQTDRHRQTDGFEYMQAQL